MPDKVGIRVLEGHTRHKRPFTKKSNDEGRDERVLNDLFQ